MTKKPSDEDHGHPSTDTTSRHSCDALLRRKGFRIKQRHKNDEPVWELQGVLFKQSEALLRLNQEDVEDAKQLNDLYFADQGG